MPDAPEAVGASGPMRREHSRDSVAHGEIGMPHNPRHGDQWPVLATGTLGCYALHKLRFPNGLHLLRAILAIHRSALDEHGRNDVVPTAGVLEQLAQDVAVIGTVPQVVMRITAAQDQEVPQSSTATMPHALLACRLLGAVLVTSRQDSTSGSPWAFRRQPSALPDPECAVPTPAGH
jgi:hypothetical protein